jgi:hypothetical protein
VRREHLYPTTSLILHTLALDVVYTSTVIDVIFLQTHKSLNDTAR